MENTTSFDLNRAIQSWRESLGQSPAFQHENLNELESHLRDSVATLQTRGLDVEESFAIAVKRIGKGGVLEAEFGKVNGAAVWLDRLFWMLIGYQVWAFVSGIIGFITQDALFFGLNGAGYDFKAHGRIFPATAFTLVSLAGFAGSLALCGWLLFRKGQRLGLWLGRLKLHRRVTLAITFSVLYLLSLSIPLIRGGTLVLLSGTVGREQIGEIYTSLSYAAMITNLVTPVVFIGLTLFLARKRLRFAKA